MPWLVLDLETVLDPTAGTYEPRGDGDTFPPPPYWQVIAIGAAWLNDAGLVQRLALIGEGKPEEAALDELVSLISTRHPCVVGVNSRGFDLPTVAARRLRYGATFDWYYEGAKKRDPRYRYSQAAHFDLTDYLSDHGAARRGSLNAWARLCGFPGKLATNGADVAELYAAGQIERIGSYCLEDIASTTALFLRVQRLRGHIDLEEYQSSARSLLDAIDREPRLAELATAIDRPRFLLTGESAAQPGAPQ